MEIKLSLHASVNDLFFSLSVPETKEIELFCPLSDALALSLSPQKCEEKVLLLLCLSHHR